MNYTTLAVALLCALAYPSAAFSAQCGTASWYGPGFHGKKTASGEIFNQNNLTAAHPTLPFGTKVLITGSNGKKVVVRINDRGPAKFTKRSIDLSKGAAIKLGLIKKGLSRVCIQKVKR